MDTKIRFRILSIFWDTQRKMWVGWKHLKFVNKIINNSKNKFAKIGKLFFSFVPEHYDNLYQKMEKSLFEGEGGICISLTRTGQGHRTLSHVMICRCVPSLLFQIIHIFLSEKLTRFFLGFFLFRFYRLVRIKRFVRVFEKKPI